MGMAEEERCGVRSGPAAASVPPAAIQKNQRNEVSRGARRRMTMLALARRALSRRSGSRWASASTRPTATPAECFVWGKGGDGALGLGDRKDCLLPEIVEFEGHDEDVCAFAAGESHSCVLDANRHLWAFGKADYGRLGTPQQSSGIVGMPTPVQVPLEGNDSVVGIDCGNYHTAAVSEQGRVYTWGWVRPLSHRALG